MAEKTRTLRVLTLGLDKSGKTSIVRYLKGGDASFPEEYGVGYKSDPVIHNDVKFLLWDVSRKCRFRTPVWQVYGRETDAFIFTIDCTDEEGFRSNKRSIHNVIQSIQLIRAAVVIYANFQDVEGAMTTEEVEEALHLDVYHNRRCTVIGGVATTGKGLHEALDWIAANAGKQMQ